MIYTLEGHTLRHAVEEMLLHLLPDQKPVEGIDDGVCDCCVSRLEVQPDGSAAAYARVRLGGVVREACRKGDVRGQDTLGRKRKTAELIRLSVYDAVLPFLPEAPVWGSLTGVRPAKLARGLMERGLSRGETAVRLREHFHVAPRQTVMTLRAAAFAQAAQQTLTDSEISLYVGIPFCPSRCAYCSFVSQSIEKSAGLIPPYLDALIAEIEATGGLLRELGLHIGSIYIGGGTPTTLSAEQLTRLMDALAQHMDLSGLREYTVEAGRPDTITPEKLAAIYAAGADRISINPQTMNDAVLASIGRRHNAEDVIRAYEQARAAGFSVVNMDTIAGLSGDTPASFAQTMETLIALAPENITVHALAIKNAADLSDRSSALRRRDEIAQMLDSAAQQLTAAGYGPYYLYRQKFSAGGFENVGWCREGTESFYNIVMMEELQTILSVGAGGVSKRVFPETGRIERVANPKYPKEYLDAGERLTAGKRKLLTAL